MWSCDKSIFDIFMPLKTSYVYEIELKLPSWILFDHKAI